MLSSWRRKLDRHQTTVAADDYRQRLISVAGQHEISCKWVPAHSGHPESKFVDQLTREATWRETKIAQAKRYQRHANNANGIAAVKSTLQK
jgi:ribonuclease HI